MRTGIWLLVLLTLAIVPALAIPEIQGYDPNYIEIDGNVIVGDGPCLGSPCTEWTELSDLFDRHRLLDGIGNADPSVLSPDSKLNPGSMLPKQDIFRIWMSNNKEYFFLAEERRSNNGNSGWHVFITRIEPTAIFGQPVVFHLQNGDLEIRICFPKGNVPEDAAITVRQVGGVTGTLDVIADDIWSSGVFSDVSAAAFAINLTPVPAIPGAIDSRGNPSGTYDTACFAEAAISLADMGIAPCGTEAYVTVITRSSCQLTSDLKDIAGPVRYNFGGSELTVEPPEPSCTTSTHFSASASGGITPYTFEWFDNDEVTPFHTATIDAEPATDEFDYSLPAGDHVVHVVVTDGADCSDSADTAEFSVYDPLSLALTKPIVPDCTNKADLSATADDGAAPYTFKWYDNDVLFATHVISGPGPKTDTISDYEFTPGDHTIKVVLTDSRFAELGCSAEDSYGPFTVYELLSLALTKPIVPDCDNTATLSATADGGAAPYTFKWYDNDVLFATHELAGPGPVTDTISDYVFTPGEHTIKVVVTDSRTALECSAEDSYGPFTVYELLSLVLTKPIVPDCTNKADLSATASGGKTPYTFKWYDNDVLFATHELAGPGPVTDTIDDYVLTPGSHTIKVVVTDARTALACSAQDSYGPFTVYGLLDVTLSNSAPTCDGAVTWTANPTGGKAPYHYEWKVGGVVVNGDSPTYSYPVDADCADHTVCVKVTDSRDPACNDSACKTINQTVDTSIF